MNATNQMVTNERGNGPALRLGPAPTTRPGDTPRPGQFAHEAHGSRVASTNESGVTK